MADEHFPDEDELQNRQATALYPVGRALRATYDAENHDSLGNDLTGLMLELARIDSDEPPKVRLSPLAAPADPPPVPAEPPPAPATATAPRTTWWQAIFGGAPHRD